MIVVGIDPGVTGALALFVGGALGEIVDMPVVNTRVDGSAICDLLDRWEPDVIYLEDVHAIPTNGSVPSFKLGLNTGIVTGVVQALGISLHRTSTQAWKKSMGLIGKDKGASRGLAIELYPRHAEQFRRVRDDGRAESVLIGRFGVYDQIRETNAEDAGARGDTDRGPVRADTGADRHPSSGARGDQREHPRAPGRGQGDAEVRPFVRPEAARRGRAEP